MLFLIAVFWSAGEHISSLLLCAFFFFLRSKCLNVVLVLSCLFSSHFLFHLSSHLLFLFFFSPTTAEQGCLSCLRLGQDRHRASPTPGLFLIFSFPKPSPASSPCVVCRVSTDQRTFFGSVSAVEELIVEAALVGKRQDVFRRADASPKLFIMVFVLVARHMCLVPLWAAVHLFFFCFGFFLLARL